MKFANRCCVALVITVNFGYVCSRTRGRANAALNGRKEEVVEVGDIRNGIGSSLNETSNQIYTYYHKAFDHFSKVKFLDDELTSSILPMEDYPLDESLGEILKTQSMASSPMTDADLPEVDANELIRKIGGLPAFPGEDAFWDELFYVALIQVSRKLNASTPFPLPDVWEGFDIHAVAEAVHDEFPGKKR